MSYEIIEAGVLTVLRLHSDYSTTNSSRGDFRILGSLASGQTRGVILTPGPVLGRDIVAAPRRVLTNWVVNVDLFVAFPGEITTAYSNIIADQQTLLDHFDTYPTLNGLAGVIHAFITGSQDAEVLKGESRNWWTQRFQLQVSERVTVTIAE